MSEEINPNNTVCEILNDVINELTTAVDDNPSWVLKSCEEKLSKILPICRAYTSHNVLGSYHLKVYESELKDIEEYANRAGYKRDTTIPYPIETKLLDAFSSAKRKSNHLLKLINGECPVFSYAFSLEEQEILLPLVVKNCLNHTSGNLLHLWCHDRSMTICKLCGNSPGHSLKQCNQCPGECVYFGGPYKEFLKLPAVKNKTYPYDGICSKIKNTTPDISDEKIIEEIKKQIGE